MQTTRESRTAPRDVERPDSGEPKPSNGRALGNGVLFFALFGAYAWFVNMLQGIDADTLFIAFFCSWLTMFVIKAFFGKKETQF